MDIMYPSKISERIFNVFCSYNSSIESLRNPKDILLLRKVLAFKQILAALMTYNILQYYFYHNIYILTSMPLGKNIYILWYKNILQICKTIYKQHPSLYMQLFFFVSIQDKQGTQVFYSCRVKKKSIIPCLIKWGSNLILFIANFGA